LIAGRTHALPATPVFFFSHYRSIDYATIRHVIRGSYYHVTVDNYLSDASQAGHIYLFLGQEEYW
jgi:hypothetical protein